jgi:glucose/arabinose dehydrogenase
MLHRVEPDTWNHPTNELNTRVKAQNESMACCFALRDWPGSQPSAMPETGGDSLLSLSIRYTYHLLPKRALSALKDIWKLIVYLGLVAMSFSMVSCAKSSPDNPGADPRIGLELIAEGFTAPVVLTSPDDGSGRLFVADQEGRVWLLAASGQMPDEPFLDLRERITGLNFAYDERGVLGLAFHPNFKENRRFFVYYSAPLREEGPEGWDHTSHLSEFLVSETDPNQVEPGSERILLQVDQPQMNHNGGQIVFGPDGFLYVPLGDGGAANDVGDGHSPQGNAQDLSNLLGSILRIDVDSGDPYGIPADNPFVGQDGLDEIWAYGLRNPFRITFDTGGEQALFVGEVGQGKYEEIDIVTKGGNYGWNIREGRSCVEANEEAGSAPKECAEVGLNGEPLQAPILVYDHEVGIAVIGGFIYRGTRIPELEGHYIFGDWSTSFVNADGRIFDGVPPILGSDEWIMRQFEITTSASGALGSFLLSLGQDAEGELYALTSQRPGPGGSTGRVYKLVPPG